MASLPYYYYIIALIIFGIMMVATNRWLISILISYMFLVLALAVFRRSIKPDVGIELAPFWSYRTVLGIGYQGISKRHLLIQIIANIVVFIPIGILCGKLVGRKAIFIGAGFSLTIELAQLISHRGLFEFDDLIDNTLGTIIGILLIFLFMKLKDNNCS